MASALVIRKRSSLPLLTPEVRAATLLTPAAVAVILLTPVVATLPSLAATLLLLNMEATHLNLEATRLSPIPIVLMEVSHNTTPFSFTNSVLSKTMRCTDTISN